MNRSGPIIIIEDDFDDQEILQEVFESLSCENQIVFLNDGYAALEYLNNTQPRPFLILSDINLPKIDGFALRDKIKNNADLSLKCIPYLFFTSALTQQAVIDAYSKSVQGFFVKPNNITELRAAISSILEYWKRCASPNNFEQS